MPPATNKKPTLAVLGGTGMLGSDLVRFLADKYTVSVIDRSDYEVRRGSRFDVFVNANGNSKRFWANEHPLEDFEASTESVYHSLVDFEFGTYVYISSSEVYPEHERPEKTREDERIDPKLLTSYGLHKYLSEQIVRNRAKKYQILRPAAILGTALKKGPFYDILHGQPLYVDRESRFQAVTSFAIAETIHAILGAGRTNEIWNVGGRGAFSFMGIEQYSTVRPGSLQAEPVKFSDSAERREYEMDVWKLNGLYPLKTSDEYVAEFFSAVRQAVG